MCSNLNANNNESTVFGPSTLYFYFLELIRYIIFHPFQCVLKQAQVVYQLQKQSAGLPGLFKTMQI